MPTYHSIEPLDFRGVTCATALFRKACPAPLLPHLTARAQAALAHATLARALFVLGVLMLMPAASGARAAEEADGKLPPKTVTEAKAAPGTDGLTMEQFLDRLMMAESGGRAAARNPRSTALGPFQFIASTWLMIANKHFVKETENLRADQILALRIDPELSRRAAEIYTKENAAYLAAQGLKPTFGNLRLAFLVGAGGAARVLSAPAETPAGELLGATVIGANPFMAKLTAGDLAARAARDVATDPASTAGVTPDPALVREAALGPKDAKPKRPRPAVACNLTLPSCRRWLALAERRIVKQRRASR